MIEKKTSHQENAISQATVVDLAKKMERMPFESILTSTTVEFIVGDDGRSFYIHRALITNLSETLKQFVDSTFTEATSGVVVWKDVHESTFVHFSQYAYTGDYQVQEVPTERPEELSKSDTGASSNDKVEELRSARNEELERMLNPTGTDLTVEDAEVDDDFWGGISKKKKKKKMMTSERELQWQIASSAPSFPEVFNSKFRQVLSDQRPVGQENAHAAQQEAISPVTVCYEYGSIILSHARLFVFADCYHVPDLAAKALARLHSTLMSNSVSVTQEDVVLVLEYCAVESMPEEPREMLLAWIVSKAGMAWGHVRFQKLLKRDGSTAVDLLDAILKAVGP